MCIRYAGKARRPGTQAMPLRAPTTNLQDCKFAQRSCPRAKDGPSEWRLGICEKPRIECADCGNRALIPVSDAVIYSHLSGEKTRGVYPLQIFRTLAEDQERTAAIAEEAQRAVEAGRKVLVLTERTDHLESIRRSLDEHSVEPFVLHGRMSKKQRANLVTEINALPPDSPRILLATGRLVGEGFDHPPLDTLVLAMPVSWKGTLQQYAGRLHRDHAAKTDVRIIDFVDTAHPALLRMWEKRQRG